METFSEVRHHILRALEIRIYVPFFISFECPIGTDGRRQSMFLAELQTSVGRRVLRVETPVAPLEDFDAEKCLRINLMQRVGYLGADFNLRELPHTGSMYSEISQWRQLKGDPAIRGALFQQHRVDSAIDLRLADVLILMHELLTERGVFHGKLHFSSNRATVWLTDDPFRYRLLSLEELTNPDLCLAYSPQPYPDTALVPLQDVMPVLEQFQMLRFMDENIYLRSGSLNIFNQS